MANEFKTVADLREIFPRHGMSSDMATPEIAQEILLAVFSASDEIEPFELENDADNLNDYADAGEKFLRGIKHFRELKAASDETIIGMGLDKTLGIEIPSQRTYGSTYLEAQIKELCEGMRYIHKLIVKDAESDRLPERKKAANAAKPGRDASIKALWQIWAHKLDQISRPRSDFAAFAVELLGFAGVTTRSALTRSTR